MSTPAVPTPTTTYTFTYLTVTSTTFVPFTTPTATPTIYPFAPADNCPSIPEHPLGLKGSCVISNAKNVSDHAFYDLYACCNSAYPQAFGGADLCTGTCVAEGQTWIELMNCLEKKAPMVVCKPPYEEIPHDKTEAVSGKSETGTIASQTGGGVQSTSSASATGSTGAASTVDVAHTTFSKAEFAMFAILAVGSAVGMFL